MASKARGVLLMANQLNTFGKQYLIARMQELKTDLLRLMA